MKEFKMFAVLIDDRTETYAPVEEDGSFESVLLFARTEQAQAYAESRTVPFKAVALTKQGCAVVPVIVQVVRKPVSSNVVSTHLCRKCGAEPVAFPGDICGNCFNSGAGF